MSSTRLVKIVDTNPSTDGCWSMVEYNYDLWNGRDIHIRETVEIKLADRKIIISKVTWGGFSREILFEQDVHSFIDIFSQHPRFQRYPFPTLLEAITELALEAWTTSVFLKTIKTFSRAVARKNKKES